MAGEQKSIASFFTKRGSSVTESKSITPEKLALADEDGKSSDSSVGDNSPVKIKRGKKRNWNRLKSDSEESAEEDNKSSISIKKKASPAKSVTPIKKVKPVGNDASPKASIPTELADITTNGTGKKKDNDMLVDHSERKLRKVGNLDQFGHPTLIDSIAAKIALLKEKEALNAWVDEEKNGAVSDECMDVQEENTSSSESTDGSIAESVESEHLVSENTKQEDNVEENGTMIQSSPEPAKLKDSPVKKNIHSFFAPRKANEDVKKEKKAIPQDKKPFLETKTSKSTDSGKNIGSEDKEVNYDPSKKKYHPIDDACWSRGDDVPYLALARTLEEIEAISARLKIVEILSNYFRSVIVLSPDDFLPSIYLCLNKLAPAYEGMELGVAETSLMKAVAQCTGRSMAQIKSDTQATGDLGIVAEQSRSTQRMMFKPAKLLVKTVYERLKEIAQMTGHAVMGKKVDKIQSMFVACRHSEARYLIRSLAGKLRIGLAEQSVLQAIGLACATTPPNQTYPPAVLNAAKGMSTEAFKSRVEELSLIIKTTYCECPNYNLIVPILLKEGVEALPEHCRLTPGVPLKPMLAHPTKGVHEVLHRFDGLKFTCEFKYDGERAQIHLNEDKAVSIYSRNQENNTSKYPDVVNRMCKALGPTVTSCILDCEAVAWDAQKKQILPFQILSTRKRKDANEADIKVAVCLFMFDLLYLNGKSLVKETLTTRRQLLKENFIETEGEFIFATSIDTVTMDEVQVFLDDAIRGNCEGLMVKTLESDATYEIAKRSHNWLKLKKDYLEGIGDTLDVVVLGGYLGRGKRAGTYGGFLLACYDPENEEYQSLCKIGTGFSDESLQQHSEFFKPHIIPTPRPYYRYDSSHEPDHWFDAVQVWEIKCADLSLSPVHRAAMGIVDPEKGISLRFPRFLRVREDKTVENATSASQVAEFYNNQDQVKNQQVTTKATEEDFY